MYIKILDTGKGFARYEEQVAAGMELYHIYANYYSLTSVDPTPEEICAMFDYIPVTEEEVYPPIPESTLDELKAQKLGELDAACADAITSGVPFDGHIFPSKDSDLLLLIAAEKTLVRYPQIPWDTLDAGAGSYILTPESYPLLRDAFEDTRIAHQMKVNTLKAQVQAATTLEEVQAIVW